VELPGGKAPEQDTLNRERIGRRTRLCHQDAGDGHDRPTHS
jgi:hypothetical protein